MKVTYMGETEGQLTMNLLSTEVNGKNWRITCMQNWTLVHAIWKAALFVHRFSYMQRNRVTPKILILRAVTRVSHYYYQSLFLCCEELLLSNDSLTRNALVIVINYWNISAGYNYPYMSNRHPFTLLDERTAQLGHQLLQSSDLIYKLPFGTETVLTMSGI